MPGIHQNVTKFYFYHPKASTAYLEISPFTSINGYGVRVRVIFENIEGSGTRRSKVFRILDERYMIQDSLDMENDRHSETFIEWMEAFYFGKVQHDVAIPIAALFLRTYFEEILDYFNIPLLEYILEVEVPDSKLVGFGRKNEG